MSESTLEKPDTTVNGAANGARAKTALISAPAWVHTGAVRAALESKGVHCFSADQVDLPGESLPHILREAVGRADLVIGVVDDTPASNQVFFEIGFAQALDKPTAVLLLADAPTSLWLSSGVPYFRYRPEVPGALDFGLNQILKLPSRGPRVPSGALRRTHPLGDRADQLLARLRGAGDQIREADLEEIVTQAIRESGVVTVSAGGPDNGIDLAVWSNDLFPWVNNPLPIELKPVLRKGDLNAAMGNLAEVMARGGMSWGLLIYAWAEGDVTEAVAVPNVLHLSAEQFLEQLRTTSFGDLIRGLRNQRVHGGC